MAIKRLSVQLANQIAAGEVVERPASVVKELLENAVDAGATSITLEIRNAGKTLVKVTDNGKGIPADELPLALAPHATSKIETLEDLSAISTLGFRGEALASIASVSRLTLVSRTADAEHAYQVEVDGAEQNPIVEPAIHNQGTSVIVRELFFNTPARRRFLKSDKTEFNHIKELITKIALVNCDVEFKFISDGKTVLNVPAHGRAKMAQRIGALLGSEFKHNLLSFDNTDEAFVRKYNHYQAYVASSGGAYTSFKSSGDYENSEVLEHDSLNSKLLQVHGVLLRPPANRTLPDRLLTFLNGRCIADRTVNHAIREAFLNVLQGSVDFKPCVRGVIFLQCDPHIVDVNVHPRKDEVRFHNSNLIHDCIRNNIYAVLAIAGLNDKNASQTSFELEDDFGPEEELTSITSSSHEPASPVITQSAAPAAATSAAAITPGYATTASSYAAASSQGNSSAVSGDGSCSDPAHFASAVDSYLERSKRPFLNDGNASDEDAPIAGRFADFGAIRSGLSELDAIRGAQKIAAPYVEAFKAAKSATKAEGDFYDDIPDLGSKESAAHEQQATAGDRQDDGAGAATSSDSTRESYSGGYGASRSFAVKPNALKAEPNIGKARGFVEQAKGDEHKADLSDLITEEEPSELSSTAEESRDLYAMHEEINKKPGDEVNSVDSDKSSADSESDSAKEQDTAVADTANDAGTSTEPKYESPYADQSAAVKSLYGGSREALAGRSLYERADAANRFERMTIDKVSGMLDALNDGAAPRAAEYGGMAISDRKTNTKFLHMVAADVALIMTDQRYFMVRLSELYFNLLMDKYLADVAKDQVRTKELSMPFSIRTDSILVKAFKHQDVLCAALRCGFSVKSSQARGCIDILSIPEFISGSNLASVAVNALQLISAGTDSILSDGHCPEQLAYNLSRCKSISINTEFDAKELTAKLTGAEQLLSRAKELAVKELNLFSIANEMLAERF